MLYHQQLVFPNLLASYLISPCFTDKEMKFKLNSSCMAESEFEPRAQIAPALGEGDGRGRR